MAHTAALLNKLTKEKKLVESLIMPNEGHGFYGQENNQRLYTALPGFLNQHIGIGAEA